jgi:hypothetical protein
MAKVSRRLERLEVARLPKSAAAAEEEILRQTLRVLSDEDVYSLRNAAGGVREGRDLTTPELSAVSAYAAALKVEVQRAGFHSIAEFKKLVCRR